MATDKDKVFKLIGDRIGAEYPENPVGYCIMQDEDGAEMLKLGFNSHRDIIVSIGYTAVPDISADVVAALAAVCKLALDKPIMTAFNLKETEIEAELSDDGNVDAENKTAIGVATAMLKEAIKVYSQTYVDYKRDGKEWHGNV